MKTIVKILFVLLIFFTSQAFSQSTWNMIGASKSEIISSYGSGIQGAGNCLIYTDGTEGSTYYFNSRNIVNKIITFGIYNTKYEANQQQQSVINLLRREGFWASGSSLTDGSRTITFSIQFKNRLYALYITTT